MLSPWPPFELNTRFKPLVYELNGILRSGTESDRPYLYYKHLVKLALE